MANINLDIQGIDKVMALIKNYPAEVQTEVRDEFEATSRVVVQKAKRNAPKDEGQVANAISYKETGVMDFEIVAQKFYAPYLEFGTKGKTKVPAGLEDVAAQFQNQPARGGFYEFALAILAWMKRKGITAGTYSVATKRRLGNKETRFNEDVELAERIAFSILKKGIKPQPFFYPAWFEEKDKLIKRLKQIIQ